MRTVRQFSLLLVTIGLGSACGLAQSLQTNSWFTDGTITAMASSGTTVYLGGTFEYVGPVTSTNGAALDTTVGAPNPAFPGLDGEVNMAIADGAGGWYIGGSFATVGNSQRNNLARINADGTVNAWNPGGSGTDGTVYALALSGDTLFVAGNFGNIGGVGISYLAAANAATGDVDPDWNPGPDDRVTCLAVSPASLFIGGSFTHVGLYPEQHLARISRSEQDTASTTFPTVPTDSVLTLAVSGDTLFVGGLFAMIGAVSRDRLASILISLDSVSSWAPEPNDAVRSLLVHGSSLYVSGDFTQIDGQGRFFVSEFDLTDMSLTGWSVNGFNGFGIYGGGQKSLAFANGALYTGGGFFANEPGVAKLVAFDSTTGAVTRWYPALPLNFSAPSFFTTVNTIGISGSQIYVGGLFPSIGGKRRRLLAAVNVATGAALDWKPEPDRNSGITEINSMVVVGSVVYVGGTFDSFHYHWSGAPTLRANLAALDGTTGAPTSWQADADNTVKDITISGDTLYAVGDFATVGASSRHNISAINISTAGVFPWNPTTSATAIEKIAVAGNTVYVGGSFNSIGGSSRNYLATIDATTGAIGSWNPNPTGTGVHINRLTVDGNTLFVGGFFTGISSQSRGSLASFNATTGAIDAWNPNITTGEVLSILPLPAGVYIGGWFASVGGQARTGLAIVDRSSGAPTPFIPVLINANTAPGRVNALAATVLNVAAGGTFDSVGVTGNAPVHFRPNLAMFTGGGLPIQLVSFTASVDQYHDVVLNWTTVSEMNNYGFSIDRKRQTETSWVEIPNSFIPGHGTTLEPHHYTFTDSSVVAGLWQYRLKQVDLDGSIHFTEPVTIDVVTSVVENSSPIQFDLEQNYPNPFNPSTRISFSIQVSGFASLKVYNVLGQEVATLVNEELKAGSFTATFDAKNIASGLYFYRIQAGNFSQTKKMLLLR